MSAVVVVVGRGLLADSVSTELSTQYEIVRLADFETDVPQEAKLVLVLHDTWYPSVHQKAEEILQITGIPGFGDLFHSARELSAH